MNSSAPTTSTVPAQDVTRRCARIHATTRSEKAGFRAPGVAAAAVAAVAGFVGFPVAGASCGCHRLLRRMLSVRCSMFNDHGAFDIDHWDIRMLQCPWGDSNTRPTVQETAALST